MKKPFFLLVLFIVTSITLTAQHSRNGREHNRNDRPAKKIRFATMDNGRQVILYPDGTWKFARNHHMPRPNYSSDIWGPYLNIYENGVKVDQLMYSSGSKYDINTRERNGFMAFGNATYTFNESTGQVKFLGKENIGNARKMSDAKNIAAYHFTSKIYNGLSSKIWGSQLIISKFGKEVDRIRFSHSNNYDINIRCRYANSTFGTASYQFNECDNQARYLGHRPVGKAIDSSSVKRIAAYHYVREHYADLICGW